MGHRPIAYVTKQQPVYNASFLWILALGARHSGPESLLNRFPPCLRGAGHNPVGASNFVRGTARISAAGIPQMTGGHAGSHGLEHKARISVYRLQPIHGPGMDVERLCEV